MIAPHARVGFHPDAAEYFLQTNLPLLSLMLEVQEQYRLNSMA